VVKLSVAPLRDGMARGTCRGGARETSRNVVRDCPAESLRGVPGGRVARHTVTRRQ
jgi:hypothetical protein